jgi:hypothetical protein
LVTGSSKHISDRHTAWVVFLSLVPWMILTVTGGGIHTHSVRTPVVTLTAGSAPPDAGGPEQAPRLQGDGTPSQGAPCTACLWQLYASASIPGPPTAPKLLPAAPCVLTCHALGRTADARSFDPRAPPLS